MCRVMEEKWEEGREEGRKEGRKETRLETAQRMLSAGKLSLEEIAEYANLPLDEIRYLAKGFPQ